MKVRLAAVALCYFPASGLAATVTAQNFEDDGSSDRPVEFFGSLPPPNTGSVSIGSFRTMTDAQIAAALAGGQWQSVLADFIAFGDSLENPARLGDENAFNVPGYYAAVFNELLQTGHPLIGKRIYTVIGNGPHLSLSSAIIIIKDNDSFGADTPFFQAFALIHQPGSTDVADEQNLKVPSFTAGIAFSRGGRIFAVADGVTPVAEVQLTTDQATPGFSQLINAQAPASPGVGLLYFHAATTQDPNPRIHRLWLPDPAHTEQMTSDPSGASSDGRPLVSPNHELMLMQSDRSGLPRNALVPGHRLAAGTGTTIGPPAPATWSRKVTTAKFAYILEADGTLRLFDMGQPAPAQVFARSLASQGGDGAVRIDAGIGASGNDVLLISKSSGLLHYDVTADSMTSISTAGSEAVFHPAYASRLAFVDTPNGESDTEIFVARIGTSQLENIVQLTFNTVDDRSPAWIALPTEVPLLTSRFESPNSLRIDWPIWAWYHTLQMSSDLLNWVDLPDIQRNGVYTLFAIDPVPASGAARRSFRLLDPVP
jgi:hypothetical protein